MGRKIKDSDLTDQDAQEKIMSIVNPMVEYVKVSLVPFPIALIPSRSHFLTLSSCQTLIWTLIPNLITRILKCIAENKTSTSVLRGGWVSCLGRGGLDLSYQIRTYLDSILRRVSSDQQSKG